MRIFFAFFILMLVGVAVYSYSREPVSPIAENALVVAENRVLNYSSEKYGVSFSYPESYQLTERDAEGSFVRERHTITLMRKEDLPVPQNGEGPPAITIDIIQNNLDTVSTEAWIREDSRSNFKLSPEARFSTTTIDGKEALSYRWDGLYNGTTVAIARPNWVYAFSVMYLEPGADIVQDFVAMRDSVRMQ